MTYIYAISLDTGNNPHTVPAKCCPCCRPSETGDGGDDDIVFPGYSQRQMRDDRAMEASLFQPDSHSHNPYPPQHSGAIKQEPFSQYNAQQPKPIPPMHDTSRTSRESRIHRSSPSGSRTNSPIPTDSNYNDMPSGAPPERRSVRSQNLVVPPDDSRSHGRSHSPSRSWGGNGEADRPTFSRQLIQGSGVEYGPSRSRAASGASSGSRGPEQPHPQKMIYDENGILRPIRDKAMIF